ncbi:MAG: hypothetical protein ABH869_06670, partial [Candidatus Omnitrophota bacterium]
LIDKFLDKLMMEIGITQTNFHPEHPFIKAFLKVYGEPDVSEKWWTWREVFNAENKVWMDKTSWAIEEFFVASIIERELFDDKQAVFERMLASDKLSVDERKYLVENQNNFEKAVNEVSCSREGIDFLNLLRADKEIYDFVVFLSRFGVKIDIDKDFSKIKEIITSLEKGKRVVVPAGKGYIEFSCQSWSKAKRPLIQIGDALVFVEYVSQKEHKREIIGLSILAFGVAVIAALLLLNQLYPRVSVKCVVIGVLFFIVGSFVLVDKYMPKYLSDGARNFIEFLCIALGLGFIGMYWSGIKSIGVDIKYLKNTSNWEIIQVQEVGLQEANNVPVDIAVTYSRFKLRLEHTDPEERKKAILEAQSVLKSLDLIKIAFLQQGIAVFDPNKEVRDLAIKTMEELIGEQELIEVIARHKNCLVKDARFNVKGAIWDYKTSAWKVELAPKDHPFGFIALDFDLEGYKGKQVEFEIKADEKFIPNKIYLNLVTESVMHDFIDSVIPTKEISIEPDHAGKWMKYKLNVLEDISEEIFLQVTFQCSENKNSGYLVDIRMSEDAEIEEDPEFQDDEQTTFRKSDGLVSSAQAVVLPKGKEAVVNGNNSTQDEAIEYFKSIPGYKDLSSEAKEIMEMNIKAFAAKQMYQKDGVWYIRIGDEPELPSIKVDKLMWTGLDPEETTVIFLTIDELEKNRQVIRGLSAIQERINSAANEEEKTAVLDMVGFAATHMYQKNGVWRANIRIGDKFISLSADINELTWPLWVPKVPGYNPVGGYMGKFTEPDPENIVEFKDEKLQGVLENIDTGQRFNLSEVPQELVEGSDKVEEFVGAYMKRLKTIIKKAKPNEKEKQIFDRVFSTFSRQMPENLIITDGGLKSFFGRAGENWLAVDKCLLEENPLTLLHEMFEYVDYHEVILMDSMLNVLDFSAKKSYAGGFWLDSKHSEYKDKDQEQYYIDNQDHYIFRAFFRQVFKQEDERLSQLIKGSMMYASAKDLIAEIHEMTRKAPTYAIEPAMSAEDASFVDTLLIKADREKAKDGHSGHSRGYVYNENWVDNVIGTFSKMADDFYGDVTGYQGKDVLVNPTRMVIRLLSKDGQPCTKEYYKIRKAIADKLSSCAGCCPMRAQFIIQNKIKFVTAYAGDETQYLNTVIDLVTDVTMVECDRYGKLDGYPDEKTPPESLAEKLQQLLRQAITSESYNELEELIEKQGKKVNMSNILALVFSLGFVMRIRPVNWENITEWKKHNDEILRAL